MPPVSSSPRQPTAQAHPLSPTNRLTLRADACLTHRFVRIECRCCAEACPTRALSVTTDGPFLGAGCVDCGRCAVVCPTEALTVPGFEVPATIGTALAVDCWRVAPGDSPPGAWRVPCLGGLSAAVLLERLAESPETELILLDRGFCGVCPASGTATSRAHPTEAVLSEVQALLHAIGFAPERRPRRLERPLPIRRMNQDGSLPLMEARLSRRAFFTGRTPAPEARPDAASIAQPGSAPERTTASRSKRRRLLAALERLARPETALPARLFPRLTAGADCADHRLCASACPSGALQGVQDAEARGLHFAPDDCLTCGVCVQLCPEQALTLTLPETDPETGPAPRQPRWISRHARHLCPECDTEHTTDAPLCPACRRDQELGREVWRTLFGTAA